MFTDHFHEHHHRNLFPLVVITITLILGISVLFLFGPQIREQVRYTITGEKPTPTVSSYDYERNAAQVFIRFDERLEIAGDNLAREEVVSAAISELLELLVTEEYRNAHLELVIALDTLKAGYSNLDDSRVEDGLRRVQVIRDQYSFL